MGQAVTKNPEFDRTTMWAAARERLRKELGDPVFDAWIGALQLLSMEKGDVKIGAPKPFVRNWVANHYVTRIERALRAEGTDPRSVSVVLAPSIGGNVERTDAATPVAVRPLPQGTTAAGEPNRSLWNRVLHPTQSFQTLVVGPANEFACRVGRSFAEGDEAAASLLYIHGGFGYGKTPPLNAMALECAQARTPRPVPACGRLHAPVPGRALHRQETLAFKEELRAAEMLLIDDLQHICRSTATISEFLHTVNAFSDLRRRIVIAADRAPAGLEGLGADIRSRLTGGLVIALDKPDRATRLAILKSPRAGVREPAAACGHPRSRARTHRRSGRRQSARTDRRVHQARDLCRPHQEAGHAGDRRGERSASAAHRRERPRIEDIQRKTAEFYKLDLRDLHSHATSRRVARPRQVAMYLARELTMRSLPEIGRRFGGRDHTTVLHACRRIAALCDDRPRVQAGGRFPEAGAVASRKRCEDP